MKSILYKTNETIKYIDDLNKIAIKAKIYNYMHYGRPLMDWGLSCDPYFDKEWKYEFQTDVDDSREEVLVPKFKNGDNFFIKESFAFVNYYGSPAIMYKDGAINKDVKYEDFPTVDFSDWFKDSVTWISANKMKEIHARKKFKVVNTNILRSKNIDNILGLYDYDLRLDYFWVYDVIEVN